MIRLGLNVSYLPAILSPISMYMWNKEAIWQETFKFKHKIWRKKPLFIFGGSWGPLRRTQVNENLRAVRPHDRADLCITREKITTSFSYMGHNIKKCIFGYSGGPEWPINNRTGPILLISYHLTYINLHIKYGSNLIMIV